ncbi:MAG: DUF4395 domain-containing protein [Sulfurimonas sp.]|nr:DUF4395 domain-containing protein [Sulfurimonas sp.]
MSYACPITFKKVDSTVSRFNAFLVSLFIIYYLFTFNVFVLYFLLVDFIIRSFGKKDYSLLFLISKTLKEVLKLKSRPYDGGAKMLAGYFGIFFLILLIIGNYFSLSLFSYIIAIIFLSCALLDVFFNYCVGCKVYFIIKKIYPNFMT